MTLKRTLLTLLCLLVPVFVWAAVPELVIQNRVASKSIAFSPDGKLIAAAGSQDLGAGVVQLWDLSTGKLLREISTKGSMLNGIAFSANGASVASCCQDGGAELWDVKTGKRRLVLSKTRCDTIAVSPDGHLVALNGESNDSRGYRNFIQLISLADGKVVNTLPSGLTWSLAFSPDGKTLASGGFDGLVRVWDTMSWRQRLELKGHNDPVRSVSISADGNLIASADGKSVRVWNLSTGAELRVAEIKTGGLAFSPVGRALYLGIQGAGDVERRLVDGPSGKTIQVLKDPWLLPTCGIFSPNGELIAESGVISGGEMMSGGIQLWNVRTGRMLRELHSVVTMPSFVAFAPQGNVLAVSGQNGVRLWDLSTLRPLPLQNPKRTDCNTAEGLAFTPSGEELLAGLRCGQLDLLSLRSSPVAEFKPPTSAFVNDFALSPDGTTVVASTPYCRGNSKTCQIGAVAWDMSSRKVKWTTSLLGELGSYKVAFSPDSKQVAIADSYQSKVHLLDAETGASISSRRIVYNGEPRMGGAPQSIAFSKNGRLAVGLAFGQIIEFAGHDDNTGTYLAGHSLVNSDSSPDYVSVLRYSPDGSLLIAGRGDGTLLFLGGSTPKEVRAHAGKITSVAFSPDGRLIATTGQDAAVRIWQASSALLLATLVQVSDTEYIITTPNGEYTASPGAFAGVAFRVGDRVYPFEQFDLQLNRPDQVLSSLGTGAPSLIAAYHLAWLGRLRRMGVDEKSIASDFHTPTLTLLTKDIGVSTQNRMMEVRVRAIDSLVPLNHLRVMVNDVPLGGTKGILLERRKGSVDVPIQIELSAGVNRIRISAVNAQLAESPSETFEIVCETPHSPATTYILAIGVSNYKNSDYNLKYASKDASDLAELFESSEGASQTKVLRLLDGEATLEHIVSAKAFLSKAGVDDTVIVFVAGHGLLDDKLNYYFATADVNFEKPAQRGLPFQALEDLLDGITSRRKLLLVDTCNSGEIEDQLVALGETQRVADGIVRSRAVRGVRVTSSGLEADSARQVLSEMFSDLRRGSGAAIISSTSGAEFAFESDKWHNGVFTYSVLEGLRSGAADANGDGRTTVSELRDYVIGRVQFLTGGAQKPTNRRESLEFDFEVSSEDFSLRKFRGVSWDNPELCAGNTNPGWCQCMLREARKHFADPMSWMDATHKSTYASRHEGSESPGVLEMYLDIIRKCGKPSAIEK
jgi:WD40 repeat protein/uncharacterized caspase-like protein